MVEFIKTSFGVVCAKDEALDTIIISIDGTSFIRSSKELWDIYVDEDVSPYVNDKYNNEIKKTRIPKKKSRPPTQYNLFLKAHIEYLSIQYPLLDCRERMRMAAIAWRKK